MPRAALSFHYDGPAPEGQATREQDRSDGPAGRPGKQFWRREHAVRPQTSGDDEDQQRESDGDPQGRQQTRAALRAGRHGVQEVNDGAHFR